jgi:pimeloyl-ACP methyl ester carboxylesterase
LGAVIPRVRKRDWIWRGWQVRYALHPAARTTDLQAPMLFIHGFGASIDHWRHNQGYFATDRVTYALDLIGFGGSEKIEQNFQIDFWVDQVFDFWQALMGQPVILVGNSIGSLVCMACAAKYPQMSQALVLINLPDTTLREDMIPQAIRPWVTKIEQTFTSSVLLKPIFFLLRTPKVIRSWAGIAYQNREAVSNELVEILCAPARDRGAANTFVALFQSMPKSSFGPSAKALLPALEIPILLLWGECDRMISPSLASQFVTYNPRIQLKMLQNTGHCPHDESPELVNKMILNWMIDHGLSSIQ